ncbi:uncharacterized protein MONOS_10758 [Monocercomonoides exilis]|uniref:uncharacterized protein n=1 Tax=Monocercomonoides exilis TaxID=2049356 RepID=UPI00355A488C|nr:hypothetical protein MONOS_10758 [Monocercomonoides exilis]|eukprot:MONOS_10758.1-p1 / transcript=MONOS_10758.1 / gene=MONOS_10758 / organism=Monocercomonoides_exilis_PA203 / gene_product=unspecified product / transcript_product=unspecified product / location=Mono_scaffold00502:43091-43818(+) / protein_length=180 / sequence_SO=supercontig / SO=protein_coding / is_pseudo=false
MKLYPISAQKRDVAYAIGHVRLGKVKIGGFYVSHCMDIASKNNLIPCRACIYALDVRAASSDSAHSASAQPLTSLSGAHRSDSQHQVAGVQRKSTQPVSGSAGVSAQACACLSPTATRSFVIVQPFYQPELSRVPHWQFFSNCREHNITFGFEGKCGVLFQLAGHLIAVVVELTVCTAV